MDRLLKDYAGQIHGYGLQYKLGNVIRDEWACFYEVNFDKDGKLVDFNRVGHGQG